MPILRTGRRPEVGLILAVLPVALLLLPGIASGDTKFKVTSIPAHGSTVEPGLTHIAIFFSKEISADKSSAILVAPDGEPVVGATSSVDRAELTKITIKSPPLTTAGRYEVIWHVFVLNDNVFVTTAFDFTVKGATGGNESPPVSLPSTGAGGSYSLALAVALLVAASLIGFGVTLRK